MCCGAAILMGGMAGVGAFLTSAIVAASLAAVPGGPGAAAAAAAAASCTGAGDSSAAVSAFIPGLASSAAATLGSGALMLEHALLLLLSAWAAASFASSRRSGGGSQPSSVQEPDDEPHATLKQLNALVGRVRALAGPASVLSLPEVARAPPPTMDADRLPDGAAAAHADARGAIYKFKIGGGATVNMYYTKAGHMRSGDLHEATQYDIVLKGRVRLTVRDPSTGADATAEYGEHELVIPPRWPHIFEFLEDNNALLEWWDAPFEAWYYGPYRSRIEARALELLQVKGDAAAATALLEQHGDGTKGDSGGGGEGKPVVKTGLHDALPVGAVVKNE